MAFSQRQSLSLWIKLYDVSTIVRLVVFNGVAVLLRLLYIPSQPKNASSVFIETGFHDRLYLFHAYATSSDTMAILPTRAVATALRTIG